MRIKLVKKRAKQEMTELNIQEECTAVPVA